jgi:hypothetical protein
MNPDKNFRMKQTIKRMLCHTLDAHERGALKRVMIQAQLTAERQQRRRGDRRQASEASDE